MTFPIPKRLALGLAAAAVSAVLTGAVGMEARAEAREVPGAVPEVIQVAGILDLDIFRRRGFPIATCEARCQEARNRCEDRARNADDRRDCRLEYGVCSNDCNVFNDNSR